MGGIRAGGGADGDGPGDGRLPRCVLVPLLAHGHAHQDDAHQRYLQQGQ